MSKSNLSISKVTPEEMHLYQAIRHKTFGPTINKILYTREPSQATQEIVIKKLQEDITKGVFFLGCRDDDTGEMIAGARWRYVGPKDEPETPSTGKEGNGEFKGRPRDRTWEEVDADMALPVPYEESDPRTFETLFALFNAGKRKNMGTRPYYCLDTLVTHPDHHRRGAGALLVKWGCEEADKKDVEAYLEASVMGAPLYERFGFRKVGDVHVDMKEFGHFEDEFDFIFMIRPRKSDRS